MKFLRNHGYDLSGFFALFLIVILIKNGQTMSLYPLLMWLRLLCLFLHQLEEYRIVGSCSGMMNKLMVQSEQVDKHLIHSQTAIYMKNYIGVFKLITWLKDKNTKYIFPKRNLLSEDRQNNL